MKKGAKKWLIEVKSLDGESINRITMIDPERLDNSQCKEHLISQFGKSRLISFKES